MVWAFRYSPMEISMKDNGSKTKCMAMEFICGMKASKSMKANSHKIALMAMGV